jgi:hypothetical protein
VAAEIAATTTVVAAAGIAIAVAGTKFLSCSGGL